MRLHARACRELELAGVRGPVMSELVITTCPSESSKTEAVWQMGEGCVFDCREGHDPTLMHLVDTEAAFLGSPNYHTTG